MPPKKAVPEDPPDMPISLRMKYGVHTIFLLVDSLAPFTDITTELLFALRDRHETGLRSHIDDPPTPLPPPDKDICVAYGVLKDPHDETKGWKDLKIEGHETPVSKGVKNNTMVAFVIRDVDGEIDEGPPEFNVQWPRIEDDEDEEDAQADAMDEDDESGANDS